MDFIFCYNTNKNSTDIQVDPIIILGLKEVLLPVPLSFFPKSIMKESPKTFNKNSLQVTCGLAFSG